MKIFAIFTALLILPIALFDSASQQMLNKTLDRVNKLEYSQITFATYANQGDYVSESPIIGFRHENDVFNVFTKNYQSVRAPIEVHQETLIYHPLNEGQSRALLNEFQRTLRDKAYPEDTFCWATMKILWSSSAIEEIFTVPIEIEAFKKLNNLIENTIKENHLYSKSN